MHRIVFEQYERAKAILTEHQSMLNRIADALIEHETLDTADMEVLIAGGTIDRPPPAKPVQPAQGEKKKLGLLDASVPVPAAGKA